MYYYLLFLIYLHVIACIWFYFIEITYHEHLDELAAVAADPSLEAKIRPW